MATRENRIRERLAARRAELEDLARLSAQDSAPVPLDQQSVGRLSRMDALQRQAMSQEQDRRRAVELQRLAAALQRLDDGEYGYCTQCGEEIPEKRLAVDPAAHLCVACARLGEG
ncbi:MAG: TraR/DksA C4-type zinc finger protein [Rhodobiaceae bacterium]|nr:TraR/DksA C4-type zinc finger protein [Rhodobiaceae bacterium]MCC0014940.1 TraR/DksA C4-type zinc finger protein [Rhodobiaceae bacterium]MCC0041699.1 TraR/DksA C4-type zinc finger protein [Rhodobiaceae bacterium]MCC0053052.1 TraR/DksA C4-type zinc finger protein [Rhodobiaceae bacterium]